MSNKYSKLKLYFSLFVLYFTLKPSSSSNVEYTPSLLKDSLPKEYDYTSPYIFYDPSNYIPQATKPSFLQSLENLYKSQKIRTVFIIIDNMGNSYRSDDGIEDFVQELGDIIYKESIDNQKSSIIILFSLKDRFMRISTGQDHQNKYPDDVCQWMINSIIPDLKKAKYDKAFETIIDEFSNWDIKFHKKYIRNKIIQKIIGNLPLIIIILFFLIYLIFHLREKRELSRCDDKLNKIQNFLNQLDNNLNKNRKVIISETCVICLDQLIPGSNLSSDEINKKCQEAISNDSKNSLIKTENKSLKISTLNCGHQFHTNCIKKWFMKNNSCPICRENVNLGEGFGNSKNEIGRTLVNIQSNFHPTIRRYDIHYGNYGEYSFHWHRPVTTTSTSSSTKGKSRYKSSSSHRSYGGSSGHW